MVVLVATGSVRAVGTMDGGGGGGLDGAFKLAGDGSEIGGGLFTFA